MGFNVGSLVRARGREWVILPESEDDFLVVRPLGGTDAEVAGIDTALETVEPASFDLPDPTRLGDFRSCRLLRDAIRLGFRSSAGPFRSFGKIAVEPRPYQFVPLLMALKLDPVRLLICDDVGIGKSIEALLIARELLDRAEVRRMAVLCPPHLAEQWQQELRDKFHIEAELGRLGRDPVGRFALGFPVYPYRGKGAALQGRTGCLENVSQKRVNGILISRTGFWDWPFLGRPSDAVSGGLVPNWEPLMEHKFSTGKIADRNEPLQRRSNPAPPHIERASLSRADLNHLPLSPLQRRAPTVSGGHN